MTHTPQRQRSTAVTGLAWGFILFSLAVMGLLALPLAPGEVLAAGLGVEAGRTSPGASGRASSPITASEKRMKPQARPVTAMERDGGPRRGREG